MNSIRHCAILLLVMAPLTSAQAPQSPELKELQPLAGAWTCTGESKQPKPAQQAGEMECRWEKKGRILICEQQMQGATPSSAVWAYAFDPIGKVVTATDLQSSGFASVFSGTAQGGKLDLSREGVWNGKPARYEFHATMLSGGASMSFEWRRLVGGGSWVVYFDGTCTKR